MRTIDWTGYSEKRLETHGWPKGTTGEMAAWLCASISYILEHSERPLATADVYEMLRSDRCLAPAPEQWRRTAAIDFLFDAIERALRSIGATPAWIPAHPWNDPYALLKRSQRDALTSVGQNRIFVHGSINKKGKQATYCPDCIPDKLKKKLGEGFVDTWREGDAGWVSAPVCDACHNSIRVVVDAG